MNFKVRERRKFEDLKKSEVRKYSGFIIIEKIAMKIQVLK